MSKPCSVCSHPKRELIDKLLVNGSTLKEIEERYGLSKSAISRHRSDHITINNPAVAMRPVIIADNDSLIQQLEDLQGRTLMILANAENRGRDETALRAIGQATRNLELMAKVSLILAERLRDAKSVGGSSPPRVVVFVSALGRGDDGGVVTDLDLRVNDLQSLVERRRVEGKSTDLSSMSRMELEEVIVACHLPLGDRVGGGVSVNHDLSTHQGQNKTPPCDTSIQPPDIITTGMNREELLYKSDESAKCDESAKPDESGKPDEDKAKHERFLLELKEKRMMRYGVY